MQSAIFCKQKVIFFIQFWCKIFFCYFHQKSKGQFYMKRTTSSSLLLMAGFVVISFLMFNFTIGPGDISTGSNMEETAVGDSVISNVNISIQDISSGLPAEEPTETELSDETGRDVVTNDDPIQEEIIAGLIIAPNPADTYTEVSYSLIHSANVTTKVYTLSGLLVRSYGTVSRSAGLQRYNIDVSTISGGFYFVTLEVDGHVYSKRITII